jgi:Ca2+-binding RTX toxin-like protein
MTTVTVHTGVFHVAGGDTLNFANEDGFFLEEQPPATAPGLLIDGTVNVALTSPGAFGSPYVVGVHIGVNGFYDSTVVIGAGGVLNVSSTVSGGEVVGYSSGSWSPDFTNNGRLTVAGLDTATGLRTYDVGPFQFQNHGLFQVTSTSGVANGVQLANGGDFHNSGDIEVSGRTGATAVSVQAHQESFDNTGTIHAVSATAGAAVAVSWGFGYYAGAWTNAGLIQGDVALRATIYSGGPSAPTYLNSGTLTGAVQLTGLGDRFTNSGTVNGDISLGAGADSYVGGAGILHGVLSGGDGDDSLAGGTGAETIDGGTGADTLNGGGGSDVLTGGTGGDLFVITPGQSPASAGHFDTITDWETGDKISFTGSAGTAGTYVESTATSFSDALTYANQQIGSGAANYVAVGVGSDVIVFADSQNDNGVADDAVALVSRTLNDIGFGNIGSGDGSPPPPSPPVSPPPVSPPPVSPPPVSPPPVSPPPVSPPPISPPPPPPVLGSGLAAQISPSSLAAFTYDATRDVIHFVSATGTLTDWSVTQKAFVGTPTTIGGTPDSVDVTADGAYLLIGNSTPVVTSAPGAATTTYAADITRVNLSTHAVDHVQFSIDYAGLERGVAHLAIAADNTVLVSTGFAGSGFTAIRQFNAEAGAPTVTTVGGLGFTAQASYLLASDTRQHLLIGDSNISDGPLHVFASGSDTVTANNDLYALGTSGFNNGQGGYNEARSLVVDVTYNDVLVLDSHLNLVKSLSTYQSGGSVLGAGFDADGNHLFLWKGSAQQILVVDTHTWQQVGTMAVQTHEGFGYNGNPAGQMQVVSGGSGLLLSTGAGAEIIDLTQSLHIVQTGDTSSQTLYGAVGADSLDGGAGNDTLVGGAGNDTVAGGTGVDRLFGGAGADLFQLQPGDSPDVIGQWDVIVDWQSSDRITFGGAIGVPGNYLQTTQATLADARNYADMLIGGGDDGICRRRRRVGRDPLRRQPGRSWRRGRRDRSGRAGSERHLLHQHRGWRNRGLPAATHLSPSGLAAPGLTPALRVRQPDVCRYVRRRHLSRLRWRRHRVRQRRRRYSDGRPRRRQPERRRRRRSAAGR